MPPLLDLPPELVEQIIAVLAETEPPSAKLLHEEPSDSLLRSNSHPLKDLSQACYATRELCFSSLFSAVKVDLHRIADFLKFSTSHSLCSHTDSLMIHIDPISLAEKIADFPNHSVWLPMVRVIDSVKPSVITVVLPPSLFANILPYELNLEDQWAFNIPYQVLQLRMPRDLAPSYQTPQAFIGSPNVFQVRPWTHCTFNQGSSIKGYSSYEYFYKQAPSIFYPQNRREFVHRITEGSFENLASLDYICVFPIEHLKYFCMYMILMKNLKCLRVQLAPTSSNEILDNPSALGKSQPQDLWQELESCYNTLALYIWTHCDEGPMSIEEFVSLDYVIPSLRELIDRTAGQKLKDWESDPSGGRWTRKEESSKEISNGE